MKCRSTGGADGVVRGHVLRLCAGCQNVECARREDWISINARLLKIPTFGPRLGAVALRHDRCLDCCGVIRIELWCCNAQLWWNTVINRERSLGDEKVVVESNSLSADNLTTPWIFFILLHTLRGSCNNFLKSSVKKNFFFPLPGLFCLLIFGA